MYHLFDYLFYFLKADKKHYRINVLEKAVRAGDGLGIKVPFRLPLFAEKKSINVSKKSLGCFCKDTLKKTKS